MSPKLFNFLSSFGLAILGVALLFAFTVSFSPSQKFGRNSFPKSNPRTIAAIGGDITPVNFPASQPVVPLPRDNSEYSATLTARSAYAVDERSGTVLFSQNPDEIWPLASISKIMSAIVIMDLPVRWDATTTVLESDCDASSHQLIAGEIYTLDDLWSAALIGSSNSALRVLVRATGLTEEEFVGRMNKKAKDLGLATLKFSEPTGLNAANVGSARDTAELLKETLRYEKIVTTLKTGEYYIHPLNKEKPRRVWSTNWLLTKWIPNDFDSKNICGKTGYIGEARYNFTVRLTDSGGHAIIVVVFGAESDESRFSEARDIADWVFGRYLWPDEDGYGQLTE